MINKKWATLLMAFVALCAIYSPIAANASIISQEQFENLIIMPGESANPYGKYDIWGNIPRTNTVIQGSPVYNPLKSSASENDRITDLLDGIKRDVNELKQNLGAQLREIRIEVSRYVEDIDKIISGIRIEIRGDQQPDKLQKEPKPPAEKPIAPDADYQDYALAEELQLLQLTNDFRKGNHLQELVLDPQLTAMAKAHADDMAQNNFLDHRLFEARLAKHVSYSYSMAAENVASGYQTPEAVLTGWLNSPGHRDNIMTKEFTRIGIGTSISNEGARYWVQVFTD